jgi:PREDICTED: similar to est1p-like protein B
MSSNAREAIRWLEGEAQRGSRFVKFLKENERKSLAPLKYPRRRDKDAQDFFAILECCNFLNQQGKISTSNKNQLVMATFIYANNNKFPSNAEAIARSAGKYNIPLYLDTNKNNNQIILFLNC